MRRTLSGWMERKIAEKFGDPFHECELCGDIDDAPTHAPAEYGRGRVLALRRASRGVQGPARNGVAGDRSGVTETPEVGPQRALPPEISCPS